MLQKFKGFLIVNITLIMHCAYFIKARYSSVQLNYNFYFHILSCQYYLYSYIWSKGNIDVPIYIFRKVYYKFSYLYKSLTEIHFFPSPKYQV